MNAVKAAIYTRLSEDATLTGYLGGTDIWDAVAPPGTLHPFLVYTFVGGGPENLTPHDMRNLVYRIKCVDAGLDGSLAGLVTERIETLMHDYALPVTGYNDAFWCMRETPDIDYRETVAGKTLIHVGGTYRVRIAST